MIFGITAFSRPPVEPGISNRWRLYMTAKPTAGSYMSACEVEMRNTPGGPNLASGGTATASTFQTTGGGVPSGGWTPAMAFDGVKTSASAWTASSATAPQWLEYAFTSPVTIEEVTLYTKHNDPGGTPSSFDVQYYDGTTWVTYWSEVWENPALPHLAGITKAYKFARNKDRRKWRIDFTAKASTSAWFSIYELEVRETIGGPNLALNAYPSSNRRPETAYQLFDADYATQWQSGSTATPLTVGLYFDKDVESIDEIVINGGLATGDSPTAGNVQYYDEVLGSWVTSWSFETGAWSSNETKTIQRPQADGVVMTEGFDYYYDGLSTPNGAQAVWVKSYLDQQLVGGRFGGRCFHSARAGGTENVYRDLPVGITTGLITAGFAWACSVAQNSPILFINQSATVYQFTLYLNNDGSLSVRTGNSGTVVATSAAGVVPTNSSWVYITVSAKIADSGAVIVNVDGKEVINAFGVDTMGGTANTVARIWIPEPTSGWMRFDDMYIRKDRSILGPCRVLYRRPISPVAGGDFNLTATAPAMFPNLIDDVSADTATYITAAAVGHKQLFNMERVDNWAKSDKIFGTTAVMFGKTDAGTALVSPLLQTDEGTLTGEAVQLSSSWAFRTRPMPFDPNTSNNWVGSAWSAAKAGIQIDQLTSATQVSVSILGYELLLPAAAAPNHSTGHRYWSLKPLTTNGGLRPGAHTAILRGDDGEVPPAQITSVGGLWSASSSTDNLVDGLISNVWISGETISSGIPRLIYDFGGPVAARSLLLGGQRNLLSESLRTFDMAYSEDGITWTTCLSVGESTPQTGWNATELRSFSW